MLVFISPVLQRGVAAFTAVFLRPRPPWRSVIRRSLRGEERKIVRNTPRFLPLADEKPENSRGPSDNVAIQYVTLFLKRRTKLGAPYAECR